MSGSIQISYYFIFLSDTVAWSQQTVTTWSFLTSTLSWWTARWVGPAERRKRRARRKKSALTGTSSEWRSNQTMPLTRQDSNLFTNSESLKVIPIVSYNLVNKWVECLTKNYNKIWPINKIVITHLGLVLLWILVAGSQIWQNQGQNVYLLTDFFNISTPPANS